MKTRPLGEEKHLQQFGVAPIDRLEPPSDPSETTSESDELREEERSADYAITIVDGLCGRCRLVLDKWDEISSVRGTDYKYEVTFYSCYLDLRHRAKEDCHLCALLTTDILNHGFRFEDDSCMRYEILVLVEGPTDGESATEPGGGRTDPEEKELQACGEALRDKETRDEKSSDSTLSKSSVQKVPHQLI